VRQPRWRWGERWTAASEYIASDDGGDEYGDKNTSESTAESTTTVTGRYSTNWDYPARTIRLFCVCRIPMTRTGNGDAADIFSARLPWSASSATPVLLPTAVVRRAGTTNHCTAVVPVYLCRRRPSLCSTWVYKQCRQSRRITGCRRTREATYSRSAIFALSRYTSTDPCVSAIYPVLTKTMV